MNEEQRHAELEELKLNGRHRSEADDFAEYRKQTLIDRLRKKFKRKEAIAMTSHPEIALNASLGSAAGGGSGGGSPRAGSSPRR